MTDSVTWWEHTVLFDEEENQWEIWTSSDKHVAQAVRKTAPGSNKVTTITLPNFIVEELWKRLK